MFNLSLPKHLQYYSNLKIKPKYSLSSATCDSLTVNELMKFNQFDLGNTTLEYTSFRGEQKLKSGIAKFHRLDEDASSQVLLFCGAQEAIISALISLLNQGDEVISFVPNYPSLAYLASQIGIKTSLIQLTQQTNWQLDLNKLKEKINQATKLIIINIPHNPTGNIISRENINTIIEWADRRGIYLLIDEVCSHLDYYQHQLVGAFKCYPRTITIGCLAKSLSLSGVRIGWAIVPDPSLYNEMLAYKAYSSICTSLLDEKLAVIALQNPQTIIDKNMHRILRNISTFKLFINDHQQFFSWVEPQAGMLACVETSLPISIKNFSQQLLEKYQLLLLPGDLFGLNVNSFRIGLGHENFAEALSLLKAHVETLKLA